MSHDSLEEETNKYLASKSSDESTESTNSKKKKQSSNIEWETNTIESPDDEW